jgi:hypothetical protein
MSLALVSGGGRVVHILIGLLARARL